MSRFRVLSDVRQLSKLPSAEPFGWFVEPFLTAWLIASRIKSKGGLPFFGRALLQEQLVGAAGQLQEPDAGVDAGPVGLAVILNRGQKPLLLTAPLG